MLGSIPRLSCFFSHTEDFALPAQLTYPEPVTPFNINEMRQCVINGPLKHPGASHVVSENGVAASLETMTQEQREALANMLLTPPEGGKTASSLNKKVCVMGAMGRCACYNIMKLCDASSAASLWHSPKVLRKCANGTSAPHMVHCSSSDNV